MRKYLNSKTGEELYNFGVSYWKETEQKAFPDWDDLVQEVKDMFNDMQCLRYPENLALYRVEIIAERLPGIK